MSDSREIVTRVWIEPGCIVCNACEGHCPEVFHVEVESSTIRPDALNAEFLRPLSDSVREAAAECPVEVIKFEATQSE